MKKLFLIVLVMVMLAATVVVAQEKPITCWVYFNPGSSVIPDSARPALEKIKATKETGWEINLFADADSLKWIGEGKKKSLAIDGGEMIVRAQSIAKFLGMRSFAPRFLTGHNRRAVLVVATLPGTPREYADAAALKALARQVAAGDSLLNKRVDQLEMDLEELEIANEPEDHRHFFVGAGVSGIYFPKVSFAVPTLHVRHDLNSLFSVQAVGGMWPSEKHQKDQCYNGLIHGCLTVGKKVEFSIGGLIAAEFNFDTEYAWKSYGVTAGLGFSLPVGKNTSICANASGIYAGKDWCGALGGLSIIF